MAATNSVLVNDTAITLDWADVTSANKYHLQVSVNAADFSGSLMVNDSTLVTSTKSFTDSGTDDEKRFWRWRYSTDGGTTWSEWSEVGSYWYKSGFSGDVTLAANKWALVNMTDVTDIYTLETFPPYVTYFENLQRIRERNRLGTLLSEYVTTKARIELNYGQNCHISHEQWRAFRRFNEVLRTFFLCTYKSNEVDVVPNVWKAQFESDPQMSMIAAGRQGLMVGTLTLIEV